MIRLYFIPLLVLILAAVVSRYGCEKSRNKKTQMELLTGKVWIYEEYYTGYNTPDSVRVYKRGEEGNVLNLDPNRVKFFSDGSYEEINENNQFFQGTWKFTDNGRGTEVKNSTGVYSARIVSLTDSNFIWFDRSVRRYGKMVPGGN
jgi:hypothetical protein